MTTCYPIVSFGSEIYVRDSVGNLNGPYDTAEEAVIDHLSEMPASVKLAIRTLTRRGYAITHWYNDGAIRMEEKADHGNNTLFTFIRTDGTVKKPISWASVQAVLACKP